MEQHVPKLETCQKLKELDFPQETQFSWWKWFNQNPKDMNDCYWEILHTTQEDMKLNVCGSAAAPLATELLEWLPKGLSYNDGKYLLKSAYHNSHITLEYSQCDNKWLVNYINLEKGNLHTSKKPYEGTISRMFDVKLYDTLAETAAQMLIYLVENKIVDFGKEQHEPKRD